MNNRSLERRHALNDWFEFPRHFDSFFSDVPAFANLREDLNKWNFNPRTEIEETKDRYLVRFDLPGMRKEDIKIDLHDNQLTISGERKEEEKRDEKKRHFSELRYGSFTRTFALPTKLDPERVAATYDNGVLNIEIPKKEPSAARTINVK